MVWCAIVRGVVWCAIVRGVVWCAIVCGVVCDCVRSAIRNNVARIVRILFHCLHYKRIRVVRAHQRARTPMRAHPQTRAHTRPNTRTLALAHPHPHSHTRTRTPALAHIAPSRSPPHTATASVWSPITLLIIPSINMLRRMIKCTVDRNRFSAYEENLVYSIWNHKL